MRASDSRRPAWALLLLAAAAACAGDMEARTETQVVWPGDAWPTSTPEAQGIDAAAIDSLVADLDRGAYGLVDQFLLIRHGYVVADFRFHHNYDSIAAQYDTTNFQYNYDHPAWHPYYRDTDLHTLQSVTKSVTSAALGIAMDEGLIAGVDVPVMPFFAAYAPDLSDPLKASITLEDFLTMRSGIQWAVPGQTYDDPEHPTVILENSDHWIQFVVDQPMATTPGTRFDYNDGVSVLIGKILREATGQRIDEWARMRLFEPIGIREFYWKMTPDGEADTEGGLYLSTHDLARIGYLFLRGGTWDGRRIVSKEWVTASISPVVPDVAPDNGRQDPGYGYQWWVPDHDGQRVTVFAGNGYGGQFLMVSPEHDMVAVFNGWNIHGGNYRSTWRTFQERILPAVME
jgi:CubicO group peptidase (beta-lactamase class C family)